MLKVVYLSKKGETEKEFIITQFLSAIQICNNNLVNEVEYVGKRQIVKIEQLATKQDNNNLKHIFVAYIFSPCNTPYCRDTDWCT